MKNCLIDPRDLLKFDFGPMHPFKIYRLGLAYELMEAYGLTELESVYVLKPREATPEEARTFHTDGYLEVLRLADSGMWIPNLFSHGLGPGDNPVFPGVYEWGMTVAGASIECAEELLAGRANAAFNISGGLHHAMPSRAAGFCHINDPVLAINKLLAAGKRTAYIDIDAHHGDGVQHAFYKTDQVLTISVHQSGHTIFPGTGFVDEIGQDGGHGYAVNVPLLPGARDDAFSRVRAEVIAPLLAAYDPDVIVTQLGADAMLGDRIANLGMSLHEFERFAKFYRGLTKPWLALGGGGYDVGNVARAWTLVFGVMNGIELSDTIPEGWITHAASYGITETSLRGPEVTEPSPEHVLEDLDRTITALKKTVFPIVGNQR